MDLAPSEYDVLLPEGLDTLSVRCDGTGERVHVLVRQVALDFSLE